MKNMHKMFQVMQKINLRYQNYKKKYLQKNCKSSKYPKSRNAKKAKKNAKNVKMQKKKKDAEIG